MKGFKQKKDDHTSKWFKKDDHNSKWFKKAWR